MKPFLLTLLLATLCATGYGQTIKALGYNTTNGQVVYTGTNNLNFISDVGFQLIESTRLDIKDGTNTVVLLDDGAAEFLVSASFLHPDGVFFTTNSAASTLANLGLGTNASVTISNLNAQSVSITNTGVFRTNLGLGATWLTNDNVTNFRTAIGLGATNDLEFNTVNGTSGLSVRQGTNFFFSAGDDVVESFVPITIYHPNGLDFAGTNAPAARVSTMRALAGSTNTNEPFSGTITVLDDGNDNRDIVISNGIILSVSDSY